SADLFLFPSLTETFGNVTLEAMASGVPTVAFDYGAAREHLTAACGRRVPFGDEGAFLAAVEEVAKDDALRASMRSAARAAVAELTPRPVTASFAALLASLAGAESDPQSGAGVADRLPLRDEASMRREAAVLGDAA